MDHRVSSHLGNLVFYIKELTEIFERNDSAIHSRLKKLEKIK